MAKSWNTPGFWIALVVAAVGLLLAAVQGLTLYMKYTAKPLHPDPGKAPAVTRSEPAQQWEPAVERARKIMRAGLSEQNLPGISVAVGVGGEIVWAEGFGWADIDQHLPVTPDTRFRIGTASQVLTSAAAGLLVQNGQLKLDAPIQTYVPEYPKKDWPVTLRQLMGNVAGVRSDGGDEGPLFSEHCAHPVEAMPFFAKRPLLFEPGTEYRNSNYGWILVSAAVEKAAREPYLSFMRERMFEPLGMKDTMAESATEKIPRRATIYFPRFAADPRYGPDVMRPLELSCYAGAMVFVSTPSDLVRFGMGINKGKLLEPATVQLLQRSQRLRSGKETGHGLGWEVKSVMLAGEPALEAGRDGASLGGKAASLMTFPERGMAVAVISNISYADTSGLALKVAEAFAEQEKRAGHE